MLIFRIIVSLVLLLIIFIVLLIDVSKKAYPENQTSYSVSHIDSEVDVVITWVDSGNHLFILKRDRYKAGKNNSTRLPESNNTFIEIGECVRLIFNNLKFIRNVIVVTCRPQTLPNVVFSQFSNTQQNKIRVIHHDQFIPLKYLPTFNSNTIEMFIHLIPGLSENFIYMNDDFYILKERKLTDFFVISDKDKTILPCYNCLEKSSILNRFKYRWVQKIVMIPFINRIHHYCLLKNLNEYMNISNNVMMYRRTHTPVPLTKKIMSSAFDMHFDGFDEIWENCRFRNKDDYLLIVIAMHYSIIFGDAVIKTKNKLKTYEVNKLSQENVNHELKIQHDFLSINSFDIDSETEIEYFYKLLKHY